MKIVLGTKQTWLAAGGSLGADANQLNSPRGVTVDQSDNVYVADSLNHRIVRWLVGATIGTVIAGDRGKGSKSYQLNTPRDLQFDQDGNLYVADTLNHRVQKFIIDKSAC
ncbi:unnamed protein product [Adineta steineri]|uniref:Uncharacterized protein n=1 Tax=Adineta steineri TaxID=433720 RepID=A0A816E505_9BILA|nr:unnamed protein product [Adineta steineri]CAF1643010.1 unnamed protein product [Adineta steineri]